MVTRLRNPTVRKPGLRSSRRVPRLGNAETLAIVDDRRDEGRGGVGGGFRSNIAVDRHELIARLWRKDGAMAHAFTGAVCPPSDGPSPMFCAWPPTRSLEMDPPSAHRKPAR